MITQDVNSLLQQNESSVMMERTVPHHRFEKLVRRLNKLQPGARYLITLTVGKDADYTILELGKVEGN